MSRVLTSRAAPAVAARPPRPVFPPRRDLVAVGEDDVRIVVDGEQRALATPIDWSAHAASAGVSDLWAMQWIEALDDRCFEAALRDWIARADLTAAASHPSITAARCVSWMQQLSVRSHRLGRASSEAASRSIAAQVRCAELVLRLGCTPAEQLDGARLLCWAGCYFEGPEADRWYERGARLLARVLESGLVADAMLAGQNASEHMRTCAGLLECRAVLGGHAIETALNAAIERACATLSDLVHPDGHPSLFCGAHLHSGPTATTIFAAAARLCGVCTVRRPSLDLERAGLCGWRDGQTYFLFAAGTAAGTAGARSDALAFEWTLHGERMFVAGGPNFSPLEIDGAGARVESVHRSRLQVLPDGLVAEGTFEPAAKLRGRPLLRRLLRSTTDALRIEDRVVGGAGQEVRAQIVCHPSARVRQSADGTVIVRRGRVVIRIESAQPISIEPARWQPDAGLDIATRRIVVHYGTAPCSGTIRMQSLVAHPAGLLALTAASPL